MCVYERTGGGGGRSESVCLCVSVGGSYGLMMVATGKRGEGADRTGNGSEV